MTQASSHRRRREEDEKEEPHTEMQTPDLSIESIVTRIASFSPEE
jgi:hypothetical protein